MRDGPPPPWEQWKRTLKKSCKLIAALTPTRRSAFLYDVMTLMDSNVGDLEMEKYEEKKKAKKALKAKPAIDKKKK